MQTMRSSGRLRKRWIAAAVVAAILPLGLPGEPLVRAAKKKVPVCKKGKSVTLKGSILPKKINSYLELPFEVARGVSKLIVTYTYSGDETVLDLGIWDADGFNHRGFRGWSGSRQGRLPHQPPVVIQADKASRNYNPARIEPGKWHVELGVGHIDTETNYKVTVKCGKVRLRKSPKPDPVDATHVADQTAGWYFGDFHMHAYHSNLNAPTQSEFVDYAKAAQLDFLPITEYQINRHWNEWGTTAEANPELIFWPGREVITYYGHANIIGETPKMVEYRHGYKDVSIANIQQKSVEAGALFQINHPTVTPPPLDFLCRGCYWELDTEIDYSLVDTIEVVIAGDAAVFIPTAIEFWEEKLLEGYFIAPTGGSDDKLGPDYGIPATAVYAEQLSRPALIEAIRAGHVWVAVLGVESSPTIEFTASGGGEEAIFGDTLPVASADFTVRVTNGMGQQLRIYQDGEVFQPPIPITSDDFTYEFPGTAAATDNPLGSYFRIETRGVDGLTTLGMPIFLAPPP